MPDLNSNYLLDAKDLMLKGKFTEALDLLQSKQFKSHVNSEIRFQYNLLVNQVHIRQGKYQEVIQESNRLLKDYNLDINYIDISLCKIEALWRLGKLTKALSEIEHAEKILHSLDAESSQTSLRIASLLYNSAVVHRSTGDLDQALYFAAQSLILQDIHGLSKESAYTHNVLGIIYFQKGKYNKALEHYNKSLDINKFQGDQQYIAKNLNNIGEIYRFKGELSHSQQYYQSSFEQFQRLGNPLDLAHSYHNLGLIYQGKGKYLEAKDHLEKALAILDESVQNDIEKSDTIFNLISVLLDLNMIDEANQYFTIFENLCENNPDNKLIELRSSISEALLLKKSKDPLNLSKSKEILIRIVEGEIYYHEQTITALIHLCDIFTNEISQDDSFENLSRIDVYITRLQNIAVEFHSHLLLVETYILQSRFVIIDGKLQRSLALLEKAKLIAKLNDLDSLIQKLEAEINRFEVEKEKWIELIQRKAPIDERIEYARIAEYVKGTKKIIALFN